MDLGTASGNDKGAITGKVKLRYDAGGSSWQGGSYNNMFKAVVVDANLTQVAPTGQFFVSDALVGKPFATEEKDLKLSFPTDEARQNFLDGKPAVMTITINNITGVLFLMKRDDNSFVATRVADRINEPFAPGTLERVPGAFCRSAQGQKDGFGQFFRQCKEMCHGFHRQFTSSLQKPGPAPKVLPAFCRVWSHLRRECATIRPFPKKHNKRRRAGARPDLEENIMKKITRRSFLLSAAPWQPLLPSPPAAVPLLLLRHPPLLPLPGALLPAPERQCGHRRFHFHEERHRCPDRSFAEVEPGVPSAMTPPVPAQASPVPPTRPWTSACPPVP